MSLSTVRSRLPPRHDRTAWATATNEHGRLSTRSSTFQTVRRCIDAPSHAPFLCLLHRNNTRTRSFGALGVRGDTAKLSHAVMRDP